MDVRQREEELRPGRMYERWPLIVKRQDGEPARVDDGLALVGVERADGVNDRAAGPHSFGGGAEERELELGKRRRAPAEVGPLGEDAEARARGVDESAVEADELRRKGCSVRLYDRDVGAAHRREVLAELAGARRVDLDRGHLAAQLPRLPARRSAEVEHALAFARADAEPGELRAAALGPDPSGSDEVRVRAHDAKRARYVGRFSSRRRVADDESHHRLERLVHRTHQSERTILLENAHEHV